MKYVIKNKIWKGVASDRCFPHQIFGTKERNRFNGPPSSRASVTHTSPPVTTDEVNSGKGFMHRSKLTRYSNLTR